jgi:DNA polymerase I-like protein with 3'-5' exonuclease and polymerase domains
MVSLPTTLLVDRRTYAGLLPRLLEELQSATAVGIDCETQDSAAHPKLKAFRESKRKTIFDVRRTVMTGFSLHCEGSEYAYYFNLEHADAENRLTHDEARDILAAKNERAIWVAHKAPYEITMFRECLGVTLNDIVCTLQMAVSAYGPDEYDFRRFQVTPFTALTSLKSQIIEQFQTYKFGDAMDSDQSQLLASVIGKESAAAHSYNGFVGNVRYGYGLKEAVKSWFGHQMATFADTLGDKKHMGELTGEQVAAYGAEDAFWVMPLFRKLMSIMPAPLIETFFKGENPLVHIFSEHWSRGLRIDHEAVNAQEMLERQKFAAKLRELRAALATFLPFADEPNAEMLEWQDFYKTHWKKKRGEIEAWIKAGDSEDDREEVMRVSSSVGSGWAGKKVAGINLTYWQTLRVIVHDLLAAPLVRSKGQISSDGDARGLMLKRFEKHGEVEKAKVLSLLTEMTGVEQGIKLYLSPYQALTDPETGRVYPELTSMLATRRLAGSNPNPQQLAKYGQSAYVRGFYLPDQKDHLIVSADWTAIELILIAELSRDPVMLEVYSQLPYGDLHSRTAAACLSVVDYPGMTEDEFRGFKFGANPKERHLQNLDGVIVTPSQFFKEMRVAVGKPSNFGYFYSGSLSTTASVLGWSTEQMWEAVEAYRALYHGAESWRVETIEEGVRNGYVTLPDGHRRVRLEATEFWLREWYDKIYRSIGSSAAAETFMRLSGKKIQTRAKNQLINALIQGLCARLAKDSILNLAQKVDHRYCSFMAPIHDELVYSVHKDYAPEFIPLLLETMCNHPRYVNAIQLDASVAVGRTFRPYDAQKAPFGQIELSEASPVPGIILPDRVGQKLTAPEIQDVLEYLAA